LRICSCDGGRTGIPRGEKNEKEHESILQKPGGHENGVFGFFGDLSMSPWFVFIELERVLITEFGDLTCEVSRSRQRVLWERVRSFARSMLLNCEADEFL
jgi:hypothetical protein